MQTSDKNSDETFYDNDTCKDLIETNEDFDIDHRDDERFIIDQYKEIPMTSE